MLISSFVPVSYLMRVRLILATYLLSLLPPVSMFCCLCLFFADWGVDRIWLVFDVICLHMWSLLLLEVKCNTEQLNLKRG